MTYIQYIGLHHLDLRHQFKQLYILSFMFYFKFNSVLQLHIYSSGLNKRYVHGFAGESVSDVNTWGDISNYSVI